MANKVLRLVPAGALFGRALTTKCVLGASHCAQNQDNAGPPNMTLVVVDNATFFGPIVAATFPNSF